ncbi:hypothetical protein M1D88_09770 [Arthrobacter sp. R1-13]
MRLLVIFGPPAVGKMTVGREIAQRSVPLPSGRPNTHFQAFPTAADTSLRICAAERSPESLT